MRQVEALDRRIIAREVDVRDYQGIVDTLEEGVAEFGKLDILVANAGIASQGTMELLTEEAWDEMLDVNLKGVWLAAKASIPHMRANKGGSMVLTSSMAVHKGTSNMGHYTAAKHGVLGLTRTLALELSSEMIRVNTVVPSSVNTPMLQNDMTYELFAPDLKPEDRTPEAMNPRFAALNQMPIEWIESVDISNAVLCLASDGARFVTGISLPVDAGALIR